MQKLRLDPKKMEVVKKTVTVAAPTGGVPKKSAKEAIKYLDSEIARHEQLLKDAEAREKFLVNEKFGTNGSVLVGSPAEKRMLANSRERDALLKKKNQIAEAKFFLEQQKTKNEERLGQAKYNAEARAAKAKEDAKPFLQKAGEKLKEMSENRGSAYLRL